MKDIKKARRFTDRLLAVLRLVNQYKPDLENEYPKKPKPRLISDTGVLSRIKCIGTLHIHVVFYALMFLNKTDKRT